MQTSENKIKFVIGNMKLVSKIRETGISTIKVTHSAKEAVQDAEIIYTDVWASMGEKNKIAERERVLKAVSNTHLTLPTNREV